MLREQKAHLIADHYQKTYEATLKLWEQTESNIHLPRAITESRVAPFL